MMAMSDRIFPYVVLPLVAATFSLLNLVHFALENLMRPSWPSLTSFAWYAAFAVIVASVVLAFRQMEEGRRNLLVLALALVVAGGFLPRIADAFAVVEEQPAAEQAEVEVIESAFEISLREWREDVAARAAEGRPWTAEEGFAFLEFAAASDLSWQSLPDHSPDAFALVREALAANVLDPDALTTGAPVADSPAVTLTLLWYDRRIRPGSPQAIEKHPWELLQMLVAAGADLTADDAASLRADLAKTVVDGGGRFISLRWGEIEAPPEPVPEPEAMPAEDGAEETGAE